MISIDMNKCVGCGLCIADCLPGNIELLDSKAKSDNKNCINCGHCIAVCPKNAIAIEEYDMSEVKEYKHPEFTINPESLLNFVKFRRSTRQFQNRDVEIDKINKIIESGRFTQTGMNLQDVSYIVVRDGLDELKKMTLETLSGMGQNMLKNLTPETMIFKKYAHMWIGMYEQYKKNPDEKDKLFFNAPAVIIVTGKSTVNASLASSNMEMMTNALGLGTFFSGFFVKAAQKNKKIMQFIGAEKDAEVITCMVIGYPSIKYLRTVPRKKANVKWI